MYWRTNLIFLTLVAIQLALSISDRFETSRSDTPKAHSHPAKPKSHGKQQKASLKSGPVASIHKPPHSKKPHKRSSADQSTNPMLLPDSSNTFERAIQNDIDELNNPTSLHESKRDELPFEPITSHPKSQNLTSPAFNESVSDPGSQDYFAEVMIEQQHYLAAIEREHMRYLCVVSNGTNCPLTAESSEKQRGADEKITSPPALFPAGGKNYTNSTPGDTNGFPGSKCTEWSGWGSCSDFCGNGVSMRYRECFDKDGSSTPQKEYRPCSNPDCLYCTEWSPYSTCNKMCGTGIKSRFRNCYMKNGSVVQDTDTVGCNFHPCQPECGPWSFWTQCTKPCDTGVTIRNRNCTLADGSTKVFYEHRACNTQPCSKTLETGVNGYPPPMTASMENGTHHPDDDGCLSAHISFERFQYNVMTIYDNTDEHNDVEYRNTVLFNGNMSCGYSGVMTGRQSNIMFYDDIFRNFEAGELTVLMWIYPIKTLLVENKAQTIFSLSSKRFDFGRYIMALDEKNQAVLTFQSRKFSMTGVSTISLKTDEWHHIYVYFSEQKGLINFHVNGRPIFLEFSRFDIPEAYSSDVMPNLGYQGFGNDANYTTPFSGVIDEIYVFKCPIEEKMILNIANTCKSREGHYCPSPLHGVCPEKLPFYSDEKPEPDTYAQPMPTPLSSN